MPANLTPDYERAERRYREAPTDEERLAALREMFATIPKHKGTEKLQADLKRRISQLRKAAGRKVVKGADPFHIPRAGAGQVVLLGAPNTGKSALAGRLTKAPVKVADYPFTTMLPVPGMCPYEDVQIELVDTPPIAPGHVPGGLIGCLRNCDLVAVVVDAAGDALEQADLAFTTLAARGLELRTAAAHDLDPADPAQHAGLILANRVDLAGGGSSEVVGVLRELYAPRLEVWPVSAATGQGLEAWVRRVWELLAVVRVYTKQPGRPPDNAKPFTLPIGSTVEDLAREIHRELPEKMRFARIWGAGRFAGQQVHRTEALRDKDVVEIHE